MLKKKRRSSPARTAMKLLCFMLGVILVVMLGTTLFFQYQLGILPKEGLGITELFSGDSLKGLLSLSLPNWADSLTGGDEEGLIGGSGSNIVNILLIGQDARENEERARSDSMILCTFNKKTKQLTMTSILRDLYVSIPGYGSNRINAAYAWGGSDLLKRTLEENFHLYINGTVEVDFQQFPQIIDLLGGVQIELRQDEANLINEETGSSLSAGVQLLTGDQALCYSRIRKLDANGDFSRTARQRRVMSALLDAYRSSGLTTMLSLTKTLLPMVTTDLGNLEILVLAAEVFPALSGAEIRSQYIPGEGMYSGQMIDGMSVLVPDIEAVRQMLEQTLLED